MIETTYRYTCDRCSRPDDRENMLCIQESKVKLPVTLVPYVGGYTGPPPEKHLCGSCCNRYREFWEAGSG